MKVTNVSIIPTEAANAAGRPALTPELLAATGARYSRNNEGLDAIISKLTPDNTRLTLERVQAAYEENKLNWDMPTVVFDHILRDHTKGDYDKGVDGIFKMVDYGHASIADMTPVAMFMDDLPIYDVYYLWSICSQAGGQESSTRYIKIDKSGLATAKSLGIVDDGSWLASMTEAFEAYQKALTFWERVAAENSEVTRIPQNLINTANQNTEGLDPKSEQFKAIDKVQKQVARMIRNYAFDRARVFLPVAAKTNVMMIQSARAWVQAIQNLLSHPLPSLNALGEAIKSELGLTAPRLIRHACAEPSAKAVLARAFHRNIKNAFIMGQDRLGCEECEVSLETYGALCGVDRQDILEDLKDRTNRYSLVGEMLSLTPVTYGFRAIAMAELRDMNRHRTGTKASFLVPMGFHAAEDQIPEGVDVTEYLELVAFGIRQSEKALQLLKDGDPTYVYYTLLGTQFPFLHTTTADKFIYTMELRTGVGAHYRYAQHCHDLLEQWYSIFPEHRGVIFEGSYEPE